MVQFPAPTLSSSQVPQELQHPLLASMGITPTYPFLHAYKILKRETSSVPPWSIKWEWGLMVVECLQLLKTPRCCQQTVRDRNLQRGWCLINVYGLMCHGSRPASPRQVLMVQQEHARQCHTGAEARATDMGRDFPSGWRPGHLLWTRSTHKDQQTSGVDLYIHSHTVEGWGLPLLPTPLSKKTV